MVFAFQVVVVALLVCASHAVPDLIVAAQGLDQILICPYTSPCGSGECTPLLDGNGSPHNIDNPTVVDVDSNGDYIIAETGKKRVLKCPPNPGGACTTVGGIGGVGSGPTQLAYVWGLVIDTNGNNVIVDKNNDRVQKCDPTGNTCETVAGGIGSGPAQLDNPYAISLDSAGDYIIADRDNQRIQKCPAASPGGDCTTMAGGKGRGSGLDKLDDPYSAVEDPSGNLFIADKGNGRVLVCPPGENCQVFTDEATEPYHVAWDTDGYVVVTDKGASKVLKCKFPAAPPCEEVGACGVGTLWGATLYDASLASTLAPTPASTLAPTPAPTPAPPPPTPASTLAPTPAPTPAPPPAGAQCFSKSQCRRALKWWQKTLARKVKRGPGRYMNGFLHDSYFAACILGAKKIAMVIPASKSCPSKVHTRRSTKEFRARAIARKQAFCKPVEYKVCSYCIQLNVPDGRGVMIETFKESVLVKPEPCKLWDFPNTPANN